MAGEDELFEIELQGVERELSVGSDGSTSESFEIAFHCTRPGCFLEVRVHFDVESVTTLEVMPRAMAGMQQAFAALARQSEAWARPEAQR